ncbi:MAG: hypothetical protein ACK5VQ_06510, partial [Gammaproteobacteria bacterium]
MTVSVARSLFAGLALAALTLSASVSAQAKTVDNSDPTKLIETSANIMTSELDARRAEFRKDPAKLRALVE